MREGLAGIPPDLMPLFEEVIGGVDPGLLQSMLASGSPSLAERELVHDILSDEFSTCLQDDWEPTERGKRMDDLLGKFLLQFPIER